MRMERARLAVTVAVAGALIAALAACSPTVGPPAEEPALRGVITMLTPGEGGGVVRVVWHEDTGERRELDACDVTVGVETEVFDEGGALIGLADLAERDIVDVWISGPIAESYPPQATADAIQLMGRFDAMRPLPIPPGLLSP